MFVAAFGHVISPVDLLTAYGLANILAAIPLTPGGLGVVEFVLVTLLAGSGLTDGQALSAVLAYRAVNFWLPIPFGGLAYASLELEQRSVHLRARRQAAASRSGPPGAGYLVRPPWRNRRRHHRTRVAPPTSASRRPPVPPVRPWDRASARSASRARHPARPTDPAHAATARPEPHHGDGAVRRGPVLGTGPAG